MIAIKATEMNLLRSSIEAALEARFKGRPGTLWEAMAYSTLGGGKRIRALLVLASCEAVGGSASRAMPAACALEMVHAFSLVHDDLPALDNSPERRNRPSCHIAYGDGIAVITGDALLALAFEAIAELGDTRLVAELAQATGPEDRKSTRLNSSHSAKSRMPSSA